MTQPTTRQRLLGLAATLLIGLLIAGVPLLLLAIGAVPDNIDLNQLRTLLTSPDDGSLALAVFATVAWIAWLFIAVSVVLEAFARIRGLPAPSLPGLSSPQRGVGQLVAMAALLFVAAPTVIGSFPTAPAHGATPAPVPSGAIGLTAVHHPVGVPSDHPPVLPTVGAPPVLPAAAPVPATTEVSHAERGNPMPRGQATINYTVKRGDSLWRIADRLLGDGARFPEIVELNESVLNGRPDFIVSGTVLKVPDAGTMSGTDGIPDRSTSSYVVRPGDTLSTIAQTQLGDPARYRELFEASRDTVQPDGAKLTDPDRIRPGWEITIHQEARHRASKSSELDPEPSKVGQQADAETLDQQPDVQNRPAGSPSAEPTVGSEPVSHDASDHLVEDVESAPGWLVPGLSGAGAVLAALVLLTVRAHRNTQLRYRRPGQTIAPPPPDLTAVEKTAHVCGDGLTAIVEHLDRALRLLADSCEDEGRALPKLVTASLAKGTATLLLAEDADLPFPWTGTERTWSIDLGDLGDLLPVREHTIAPFPLLATVGQDGTGALHLVNFEHLGVVTLTGDPDAAAALARHIAAELALNPWSVLVDVTLIGLGGELATLDPVRLQHHADGESVITELTQTLSADAESGWGDPDPYRFVITADVGATELASLIAAPASCSPSWTRSSPVPRLGAAVVSLGAPVPDATLLEVDRTGRLRVPVLGLDVEAAGLTSQEAAACTAIVDLTRESKPVRMAPFNQAADGWRALADQSGALREELTDVREEGPAGAGSLLPEAAEAYTDVAATTVEDIDTLAPAVSDRVRRTVEEADPALDGDVADWFDPESTRPRLTLLGAVHARVVGTVPPAITKRKPYFIELLAFLALHPDGATGNAVADAFSVAGSRARTDLGILREWLGHNSRTSQEYLPPATKSRAFQETGVRTYQVDDVLVDVDLFRRLRARGQARGVDGIPDLTSALKFVAGIPFSNLRDKGWSWLLDTERFHETISCAVVDTAHILVVDALARCDLATARDAAETACRAAPYDDICRLDLVKVAAAGGHAEAADRILTDEVFLRTDDYLPPISLPERTGEVIQRQGWGTAKRRPGA